MIYLILGLVLFLSVHSVRLVADDWRTQTLARVGEGMWKGLYSLVSLVGFGLLVWGYGQARLDSPVLYDPPLFTRHITSLLMLVSLVLVVAAYVPGNHIKAAVGHPMLAGTKVWAFAHLLSNGRLADVLLFGSFMAWAVVEFVVMRRRDRVAGVVYPVGRMSRTLLTLAVGVLATAVMVMGLHRWLIGVPTH